MASEEVSANVVISYARTDSDFVDRLEADLRALHITTWVDRRKLEGGQVWNAEIHQAIDRCQILLVVLSPDALNSRWVRQEYSYALSRGKEVIPLLYYPCPRLPRKLAPLQWLDFRAGVNFEETYQARFEELLKAIAHHVGLFTTRQARLKEQRTAFTTVGGEVRIVLYGVLTFAFALTLPVVYFASQQAREASLQSQTPAVTVLLVIGVVGLLTCIPRVAPDGRGWASTLTTGYDLLVGLGAFLTGLLSAYAVLAGLVAQQYSLFEFTQAYVGVYIAVGAGVGWLGLRRYLLSLRGNSGQRDSHAGDARGG